MPRGNHRAKRWVIGALFKAVLDLGREPGSGPSDDEGFRRQEQSWNGRPLCTSLPANVMERCTSRDVDLVKRVWQHREGVADGFTKIYGVKRLVWYECHEEMLAAIAREKHLKMWNRAWKIALIQKTNPEWRDLYEDFTA